MLRYCLLAVVLGLWAASSHGAELPRLQLSAGQLTQPVAVPGLLLLQDKQANLGASEALQRLSHHGQLTIGTPSLGYSASAWWAAFQFEGPVGARLHLILDAPNIKDVRLWVFDQQSLLGSQRSGTQQAFMQRGEPYPSFMLDLPKLRQGTYTLLLRVQSDAAISLPLKLVNAQQNGLAIARAWLASGLMVGALLSLVLFYLFKYLALREPHIGYFCITALGLTLYSATHNGLIVMLLGQWPALITPLLMLSTLLMLIYSSLFISNALQLTPAPGPWRRLRDGLFLTIGLVCTWCLFGDYQSRQILNLLVMLTGLYQFAILLQGYRLGRPYAMGYLICWSSALLMMLLVPLSRLDWLPLASVLYSLQTFLPMVSFLLFGALLDRQQEHIREALLHSQSQAIDNLEQYRALFSNAHEGIFRCNQLGQLQEANPSLVRFLGAHQASSLIGQPIQRLLGERQWQTLLSLLGPEQNSASLECRLLDLRGRQHWVYLSLHQPKHGGDCIEGIVVDLSERRALEERLQELACLDSLTGLLNRRRLEQLLQECLNLSQGRPFSHLLFIDLDQFKQVNDLCGHSAGDQLLRQLAQHMQNQLPSHAQMARIGGDEFAVLLREDNDNAALAQAERLRQSVCQFLFSWEGRPFRLYASIGLLPLDGGVCDWETALHWADSASQLAKDYGRNRVHAFNPADGALLEHQRQLQWITRLQQAIEHGHFELFFQSVLPLQRCASGLHYEILLRYRDPNSGEWISPAQFLGAAARYGLLGAIDEWVISRLFQWLASNPLHLRQLSQVNINLSATSLLNPTFHGRLRQLQQAHCIAPEKICIEVTEMVALGELAVSAQWLKQLREQGLKVALDDFGSGFASYAYLRNLPLDILKIDGSFIRGIEHDPINQAMVRSMQQLARQLKLTTVAEFVETEAALNCLRNLGIDCAQGYFIDRPQPLAQLADGLLACLPEHPLRRRALSD